MVHRTMMPQSPSKKAPWDLTWFSQLQHDAPSALVSRSQEQICHNMFQVRILCQNLRHSNFWNPQISFMFSYSQLWIFVDSQVFCLLRAFQKVGHFWQILNHLWSICASLLFALHSLHCLPKPSKITQIVSAEEYSMSTQRRLLPPLTSTAKSSLFMHVHSSPLSLAARLHQCCSNLSCYIDNGWTFSGLAPTVWMCLMCMCVCLLLSGISQALSELILTQSYEKCTIIIWVLPLKFRK